MSASGVVHWLRSDARPRRLPDGAIVWDGLAIEIGPRKRWQSEIAELALRDPLTGLLRREAWGQAVALQLAADAAAAPAATPDGCGLLYFDIADFHDLNRRLGPRAADEVLREVAGRLAALAASVGGAAARLGGDEFAILYPSCADDAALVGFGRIAADALARPIQVGARGIPIRVALGMALCPPPASAAPGAAPAILSAGPVSPEDSVAELKARAEIALRWAKQDGGIGPLLYSAAQDDRFHNQAILAASLERAIADNELELHYQPLVDLASGSIVSAEALVRWRHPALGVQRPDLFIPLAEKMGLIGQLGRWVLGEALRQRKAWAQDGLRPPPIAINVSGDQLSHPGFAVSVAEALQAGDDTADGLELELTEGLLIQSSPYVLASLHALQAMGFTIAIDDFGSGHASFRYLRDFPVDKLKIDQMFVRKLVTESTDALIIRAIISLARGMGIACVAEGIESELQRDFLLHEGCEIGQGYLFSLPLVAEDFAWLLANDVRLPLRRPAEIRAA